MVKAIKTKIHTVLSMKLLAKSGVIYFATGSHTGWFPIFAFFGVIMLLLQSLLFRSEKQTEDNRNYGRGSLFSPQGH